MLSLFVLSASYYAIKDNWLQFDEYSLKHPFCIVQSNSIKTHDN